MIEFEVIEYLPSGDCVIEGHFEDKDAAYAKRNELAAAGRNITINVLDGIDVVAVINHLHVDQDSYFLGQVTINAIAHKSWTECEVKVVYTPEQEKELGPSYIWHVDIDRAIEDPAEALEELKKEEYYTKGESQTI